MAKTMITNRKFSETDKMFIDSCEFAKIPPTSRQASKWRRKIGSAYMAGRPLALTEKMEKLRSEAK